MRAVEIGELLLQLAKFMSSEPQCSDLTRSQWLALRFLNYANVLSRTVSGLAAYQDTTHGTASQTIKALVAKGYVAREWSHPDGRRNTLNLTDRGRVVVASDPVIDLFAELVKLEGVAQDTLHQTLMRLVKRFATANGAGFCESCHHCGPDDAGTGMQPAQCLATEPATSGPALEGLCTLYKQKESEPWA